VAAWTVPMREFAKKAGLSLDVVARKIMFDMFSNVIRLSPVDTGRFRANWNVGYGVIDDNTYTTTNVYRVDAQLRQLMAKDSVTRTVVYFTNSLPYALPLEYGMYPNPPKFGSKKKGEDGVAIHVTGGYSMQAPRGMVRITVAATAEYIRKAVAGT